MKTTYTIFRQKTQDYNDKGYEIEGIVECASNKKESF